MLQRLLVGLRSSEHPVLLVPLVPVVPAAFLVLQLVLQLVPVLGQLVASSVHPLEASLEPPVVAPVGLPPSEPLEEAPLGLLGTSLELGSQQFLFYFLKLMKVETRFTR